MVLYNLTNVTAANNPLDFVVGVNDISGGSLSVILLVGIFFISFLSMKQYEARISFAASSFITAVIAALFTLANFLDPSWLIFFSVVAGLAVTFLWFGGD